VVYKHLFYRALALIFFLKQKPGSRVDWKDGITGILAFFPVVAISSNFSTRFDVQRKQEIIRNARKN